MPQLRASVVWFLISSAIFKSFQEKKPKIFPYEAFIFCVVDDFLSKYPNSKKPPLA